MSQYMQLGICNRIIIGKERLSQLNLTIEKVIEALSHGLDMSLYEQSETENSLVFSLKESIVMEELVSFLRSQYELYIQEKPYTDDFELAVTMISELNSIEEIEELAKGKSIRCFQRSVIDDEISINDWHWLRVEYSLWLMFVEGKIIMECYNNFLKFTENQVRKTSKELAIAGAFRCFIQ
jgi:hypothetical protein